MRTLIASVDLRALGGAWRASSIIRVVGDRCAEHDVGLGFEQMILCGKTFHQVAGWQCRRAADTPADMDDRPRQVEPAQGGVGAVERFGELRVEIVVRGRCERTHGAPGRNEPREISRNRRDRVEEHGSRICCSNVMQPLSTTGSGLADITTSSTY
ncbi:hypothetical protein [Nocardia sp. XZ_19_231]|uniref:hypothetical protein n=1 Tax=Nocardia sp. XZ_19_231 TaxID=2769252 RepID=UPI00188DF233|nr:hypothetical protein [Nocardia sp. XZ_19_231]